MKDIDYILRSQKYLNVVDPNTIAVAVKGVGDVSQAFTKPDLGKLIAQRCGRKGLGYVFSRKKKKKFAKCSQSVTDDWNKQYVAPITIPNAGVSEDAKSLMQQQSSNTNKILIALGVVVLSLVGYIAIKK